MSIANHSANVTVSRVPSFKPLRTSGGISERRTEPFLRIGLDVVLDLPSVICLRLPVPVRSMPE